MMILFRHGTLLWGSTGDHRCFFSFVKIGKGILGEHTREDSTRFRAAICKWNGLWQL